MAEDKKILSLEELNKQYVAKTKQKTRRKQQKATLVIIMVLLLLIVVSAAIAGSVIIKKKLPPADNGYDIIAESVLTEKEQEKWNSLEVDGDKVYIELNNRIQVDERKAAIRLLNPIYCNYTISIKIYLQEDQGTILYQSERLQPGTVLEYILLTQDIPAEECEAVVEYTVYDDEGNEKATYPVDIKLIRGTNQMTKVKGGYKNV